VTLRNRISIAAAVLVLLVVACVSIAVYVAYAASLRSRVDGFLVNAAEQAASIAGGLKQKAAGLAPTPPDLANAPVKVGGTVVQLLPGPLEVGQSTAFGPLGKQDLAVAQGADAAYFTTVQVGKERFRVYTASGSGPSARGIALVRAGRAANADDGALRTAGLLLAGLTLGSAAVTYGVARLSAGRVLRPIGRLTAAAEHVTATGDLSARIGASGSNDEVGRLGVSFDTMLVALDNSVTAQRQLVADASHELRTPLTSLTTNLDLLGEGAGVADPQAPSLVRAAREQAGELDQLVSDLVDVARYGESTPHRETVRLDLLTGEALQRVRQRTPGAVIDSHLQPCLVHVDPAGVDHAVCNLIDNAIKWSPPDGVVHVVVADGRISVSDRGPGIPPEDLPHIFERFYRAPAARGMAGAGLGLAIVARVAQSNDATPGVRTGPDGSTFTLTFPPPPPDGDLPPGS
jgi:two-component system sensor histidine kinase MprB